VPGASGWPMASGAGPGERRAGANGAWPESRAGAGVLAERIASTLVNHEPGWRLPRPSALARRHNVSTDEVLAAVEYLISQQLVRRSPDGNLYRSSPADYLISVEGIAGLGASVDPMGANLTCVSYGVSRQPASEAAACALGVQPGEPVGILRLAWAVNGTPAAVSTTHLAGHLAEPPTLAGWLTAGAEHGELPLAVRAVAAEHGGQRDLRPRAVAVQMELPPASVAKRLRLRAGQMAVLVTVVSGDGSGHAPAALTATVLRPDMFRISVEAVPPAAGRGSHSDAWLLAAAESGP
jgi:DNA-binding GntR family transcriptional regulator